MQKNEENAGLQREEPSLPENGERGDRRLAGRKQRKRDPETAVPGAGSGYIEYVC